MSAPFVSRLTQLMGVFFAACTCLVTCSVTLASRVCAADELPRYRFEVGQEISYRSDHELPAEPDDVDQKENGSTRSVREWTIWVVRQSADSTWRLIFRMRMLTIHKDDKGDEQRRTDHTFYAYADVTAEGRIADNPSLASFFDVRDLFPQLPADEKSLRNAWAADSTYRGEARHSKFRPLEKQSPQSGELVFEEVRTTDLDPIHLAKRRNIYRFNLGRGLTDNVTVKSSYGWPANDAWGFERTYKLVEMKHSDADWLTKLDADMTHYFAPIQTCDTAIAAIQRDARATEREIPKIEKALEKARSVAQLPLTRKLLDDRIEGFQERAKSFREEAARLAPMFGKPAREFELEDLNGKKHKLSDYRGKIVVLDFWNRSCGYCIRAFPAFAQLAKDFDGKPVAILGMNDDEHIGDAQFVHDHCKIPYPTLRAADIVEEYGVNSWPTVFVIDTAGNVRQVRRGNVTTLREELTAQVNALLKEAQQP